MCISWSINTYGRRQLSDCSYLATPEPETMSEVSDLGKGKKITGLLLQNPLSRRKNILYVIWKSRSQSLRIQVAWSPVEGFCLDFH